MYVTLKLAKKHLNIDDSFTEDDNYITSLIKVAEDAVAKNENIALKDMIEGGELPSSIIHSILLLVGNLYNNREATSYSVVSEVPYTYKYLINLNRNFTVGWTLED